MSSTIQWLWLTTKQGITPHKIAKLMEAYGSIEEIYKGTSYNVRGLTRAETDRLLDKSLDTARQTFQNVLDCGASILTCDNKFYPECLRNISPMPYVLYMKGTPVNFDKILGIGIVGTRLNTDYGAKCAYNISYGLGERGAVIISGMALGIDSIAMHAAVKAGAYAIGVLGCGIDIVYPQSNDWLFREITKTGLIISEYPPGTRAFPGNFPQRNRIIAGLSKGVLVIEGAKSSGSMITARLALEYNRDLYAVPRCIGDVNAKGIPMDGTNHLIRDGAKLTLNAEDILCEYEYMPIEKRKPKKKIRKEQPPAEETPKHEEKTTETNTEQADVERLIEKTNSDIERSVIMLLKGGGKYADEIVRELDGEIGSAGVTLTLMETMGFLKRGADGRYELNI
ncbi:MAG: DNA-processing protein DprA [Clostridia bacterium]|nr:DNA-processing protein DprA [Clostridia bacterium]